MRIRRPELKCRTSHSVHELFLIIVVVATISVIVTYQVSKYLLHKQQTELKIQFNGRLDIYRNFDVEGEEERNHGEHAENVLEGIESEEAWSKRRQRKEKTSVEVAGKDSVARKPRTPLEQKLLLVEEEWFQAVSQVAPVAVLCGEGAAVDAHRELYQAALAKHGFTLISPPRGGYNTSEAVSCSDMLARVPDWSMLLCLVNSTRSLHQYCPLPAMTRLHAHQQVNYIPGVGDAVWRKDGFCCTMTAAAHIPVVKRSNLFLKCYVLPGQFDEYLGVADALGDSAKWVFKSALPGGRTQLLQPTQARDYLKIKELSSQEIVIQRYLDNPLLLFGMPFSVTAYILVTSVSPLRAFIHTEGVVQHRRDYQGNFRKVVGRTWSLEQLKRHLTQTYGKDVAQVAFRNLDSVVTQTLLVSESSIMSHWNNPQRCPGCYQMLGIEVIYNSSFHPVVVEVSGFPGLAETSRLADWPAVGLRNPVIEDMMTLLYSKSFVAGDVAKALEELAHHVGILNLDCQPYHKLCLTTDDLHYLLTTRRQALYRAGFAQLYPSYEADKYSPLVEGLQKFVYRPRSGLPVAATPHHSTADLHSILVSMAHYYHNMDAVDDSYDDLNVPMFQEGKGSKVESNRLVENIFSNSSSIDKKYIRQHCSEDRTTMPLLEGFYSEPSLNLTPAFNPSTTEYYATVTYDVFLIKVWAFAQSCNSEARLEDKYGLSRQSNYTLGLGGNRVNILVVDVTHTEPWILTTYTINIYRQSPGEALGSFDSSSPHAVCSFKQDCDLAVVPYEPCGLEASLYKSWNHYLTYRSHLPNCTAGDAPGTWLVPCVNCSSAEVCFWKSAVWQPYSCSHPRMTRDRLKQCLAGKRIMFIGDSTNRGIMHYLMEQANDSLTEWDKTHNIKVYTNINQERTTVSFAYYPQFWLPANQRPVFDKALFQLMKKSLPLENSSSTVLIVGGVHWLATHHLNVITKALKREGLSNIRVIMKGLGAGFHQPVDGLHCLSQAEQRKLLLHSQGLNDYARHQGFQVVDTFNMTMARYKHFLQGQCACHFHRVRETLPSFTQFMQSTGAAVGGKLVDMPIYYHVEGDVNLAYSEILLNRICDYGG